MAKSFTIAMTGVEALDQKLKEIATKDGAKGINGAMRKALKEAVTDIVLPQVLDLIPVDTGELEEQVKVRAIDRSRGKIGFAVGFKDPLFQGDTFYGGFIEFGFTAPGGVHVEADSYLRRALYPNADIVIARVRDRITQYIDSKNKH